MLKARMVWTPEDRERVRPTRAKLTPLSLSTAQEAYDWTFNDAEGWLPVLKRGLSKTTKELRPLHEAVIAQLLTGKPCKKLNVDQEALAFTLMCHDSPQAWGGASGSMVDYWIAGAGIDFALAAYARSWSFVPGHTEWIDPEKAAAFASSAAKGGADQKCDVGDFAGSQELRSYLLSCDAKTYARARTLASKLREGAPLTLRSALASSFPDEASWVEGDLKAWPAFVKTEVFDAIVKSPPWSLLSGATDGARVTALLEALGTSHDLSWWASWGAYTHTSSPDNWRDFLAVAGVSAEDAVVHRLQLLEADQERGESWNTLLRFVKVIRPLKGERVAHFFAKHTKSKDKLLRAAAVAFFADAPALTKTSSRSKKTEPKPKTIVGWLKTRGSRFEYEMSDFDVSDTYLLGVSKLGKRVSWVWDGAGSRGEVTTSAASLETAREIAFISQGTVTPERATTPPFLVSRSVAKTLKAGKRIDLEIHGAKSQLEKTGIENVEVDLDGKKTKIAAIHASGDDLEIWFVDDPEWPVILKAEFQGDNEITLKAVHAADT